MTCSNRDARPRFDAGRHATCRAEKSCRRCDRGALHARHGHARADPPPLHDYDRVLLRIGVTEVTMFGVAAFFDAASVLRV